jgi:chromosome segregation ATPase
MTRLTFASILWLCTYAPGLFAQSPDSASLQALVTEIHQLRLAVERAGATTPKIQITLQRLQLQEQKMARISGQLADLRKQIAAVSEHNAMFAQNMDTKIEQEQDVIRRKAREEERRMMNAALEQQVKMLQDLRAQEAELAGTLRTEQAKADELNDHLAALERSLDAPPSAPRQ